MAAGQLRQVVQHLRATLAGEDAATDADLLKRWCAGRHAPSAAQDERAFETLVRRHGPMVMGVCRRILHNRHDAEDAFQATFLVLVRKAGSLRSPGLLGNWLYGVALRTAKEAKRAARRRQEVTMEPGAMSVTPVRLEDAWAQLRPVLDHGLELLPDKYRAVIVLCDLEGKSRKETARQLGWPEGTVAGRLARARTLLAKRLARHAPQECVGHSALSAAGLAALLSENALASVPPAVLSSTIKAAFLFSAGSAAATGPISAKVAALTERVLKSMFLAKLKIAMVMLIAGSLVLSAAGLAAHQVLAVNATEDKPQAAKPADLAKPVAVAEKQTRTDRYGDPLPEGALARLGTTRFRHGGYVGCVAFCSDGKTLASCGQDNTIRFWEVSTGKELRRLLPAQGEFAEATFVKSIALSPDGRLLASGTSTRNYTVRLWDASTGRELRRFNDLRFDVATVAFSPDGSTLAAGGTDEKLCLWDVATGKQILLLNAEVGRIQGLAFAPDGKRVACCGEGLTIFELETGKFMSLKGHQRTVNSVAFAPDGRTLVSAGNDPQIRVWDPVTGKELRALESPHVVTFAVAFSPDGRTLASTGLDGSIRLWDVKQWQEKRTMTGHHQAVLTLGFSRDGKFLASGGYDQTVRIWEVAGGKEITPSRGHQHRLIAVAFSADDQRLITTSLDGSLRLWEAASGTEATKENSRLGAIPGHYGPIGMIGFSPDGHYLVAEQMDAIRRWDLEAGKELPLLKSAGKFSPHAALSSDGKTIAAESQNGKILLWETATGKLIGRLAGKETSVTALALSTDGKFLAAAMKGDEQCRGSTIDLWETGTGKQLWQFHGPNRFFWINALVFSPDGKILVAGVQDLDLSADTTRVWEVSTGKELPPFKGRFDSGRCLAFSPDGRTLANGEGYGSVRLWEVATRQERLVFRGHVGPVSAVAFSHDGKRLVSAGWDTTALLWDITGGVQDRRRQLLSLSNKDLGKLCDDLAGADAPKAFQAILTLAAVPEKTLPFLSERLQPAPDQQLKRLIANLGSDRFAERQQATQELDRLTWADETPLRRTLASKPSPEVRRRLEDLLKRIETRAPRIIEVVEHIDTPEARHLLESLAKGAPEARLIQEAKAALDRLHKRADKTP